MRFAIRNLAWALVILWAAPGQAADSLTEHTYRLSDGEVSPEASLAELAWLAGSWTGECFEARCEEVWNAPSAGSMVGLFKLFDDEGVRFYELMVLELENGSPVLKVRHFNADLSAWEDKTGFVSFPLVRIEPDAVHFRGLSFYRRAPDRLDIWIVLRDGEAVQEHRLQYRRVGAVDEG